jgi:hypothetical protein
VEQSPLEKLIVTQLVKKLLALYGNRRFITVLIRALHWCLSWARCIQFTSCHCISLRYIIILFPSVSWSYNCSLAFRYCDQNLCEFLTAPMHATCPVHIIFDGLTSLILFSVACKLWSSSLCSLHQSPATSSLLDPYTPISTLFSCIQGNTVQTTANIRSQIFIGYS